MSAKTFKCPTCDYRLPDGHMWPHCGAGTSWKLLKCPECSQLFAYCHSNGYIPTEVLNDPEVEVVALEEIAMPAEETTIAMQCIICKDKLERCYGPAQPVGALCFSGSAHYGSTKDMEHQIVGLDYYEIFICDPCWTDRRELAIGVKKETPLPKRLYFTGKQIEAAFAESKHTQEHVRIGDMFTPETD